MPIEIEEYYNELANTTRGREHLRNQFAVLQEIEDNIPDANRSELSEIEKDNKILQKKIADVNVTLAQTKKEVIQAKIKSIRLNSPTIEEARKQIQELLEEEKYEGVEEWKISEDDYKKEAWASNKQQLSECELKRDSQYATLRAAFASQQLCDAELDFLTNKKDQKPKDIEVNQTKNIESLESSILNLQKQLHHYKHATASKEYGLHYTDPIIPLADNPYTKIDFLKYTKTSAKGVSLVEDWCKFDYDFLSIMNDLYVIYTNKEEPLTAIHPADLDLNVFFSLTILENIIRKWYQFDIIEKTSCFQAAKYYTYFIVVHLAKLFHSRFIISQVEDYVLLVRVMMIACILQVDSWIKKNITHDEADKDTNKDRSPLLKQMATDVYDVKVYVTSQVKGKSIPDIMNSLLDRVFNNLKTATQDAGINGAPVVFCMLSHITDSYGHQMATSVECGTYWMKQPVNDKMPRKKFDDVPETSLSQYHDIEEKFNYAHVNNLNPSFINTYELMQMLMEAGKNKNEEKPVFLESVTRLLHLFGLLSNLRKFRSVTAAQSTEKKKIENAICMYAHALTAGLKMFIEPGGGNLIYQPGLDETLKSKHDARSSRLLYMLCLFQIDEWSSKTDYSDLYKNIGFIFQNIVTDNGGDSIAAERNRETAEKLIEQSITLYAAEMAGQKNENGGVIVRLMLPYLLNSEEASFLPGSIIKLEQMCIDSLNEPTNENYEKLELVEASKKFKHVFEMPGFSPDNRKPHVDETILTYTAGYKRKAWDVAAKWVRTKIAPTFNAYVKPILKDVCWFVQKSFEVPMKFAKQHYGLVGAAVAVLCVAGLWVFGVSALSTALFQMTAGAFDTLSGGGLISKLFSANGTWDASAIGDFARRMSDKVNIINPTLTAGRGLVSKIQSGVNAFREQYKVARGELTPEMKAYREKNWRDGGWTQWIWDRTLGLGGEAEQQIRDRIQALKAYNRANNLPENDGTEELQVELNEIVRKQSTLF